MEACLATEVGATGFYRTFLGNHVQVLASTMTSMLDLWTLEDDFFTHEARQTGTVSTAGHRHNTTLQNYVHVASKAQIRLMGTTWPDTAGPFLGLHRLYHAMMSQGTEVRGLYQVHTKTTTGCRGKRLPPLITHQKGLTGWTQGSQDSTALLVLRSQAGTAEGRHARPTPPA